MSFHAPTTLALHSWATTAFVQLAGIAVVQLSRRQCGISPPEKCPFQTDPPLDRNWNVLRRAYPPIIMFEIVAN